MKKLKELINNKYVKFKWGEFHYNSHDWCILFNIAKTKYTLFIGFLCFNTIIKINQNE